MNPRQSAFVLEYLVDGNATAAYLRAGYKAKSRHVAEASGSDLLRHPEVAAAIRAHLEERGERIKASADRVLLEIERMALVDPGDFAGVTSLAKLRRLPAHLRRAVVGWTWTKSGKLVLKLAKERMIERLGSHHKLFTDKVEVSGTLTLEQILARSNAPAAKGDA